MFLFPPEPTMNYRFPRKTTFVVLPALFLLLALVSAVGQGGRYDPGQGVDDLARQMFPGKITWHGQPVDPGQLADELSRSQDRKALPPSAYGEPVVASPPPGPTAATSAAAAGVGKVRGRVDCQTANYCLFTGLALIGTIDDAMTKQLIGLFEEFDLRVDPKIQTDGFFHTEIRLNSVGGSVSAAMEIGRLLRKHRMRAVVRPTSICVSACVLIYAGAVTRFGHFNAGKIGIHQPYLDFSAQQKADPQAIKNVYARMLLDMKAYLREMNVSEQLADEMLKVPSTSVRYLSNEDQDQLGLATYDPVEVEISEVELAQKLGLPRPELMRREVLAHECFVRDTASHGSACYDTVMNTGKLP
jgi:ATP-dependent protease ClpP protease subunit